jgi:hypothetical protein
MLLLRVAFFVRIKARHFNLFFVAGLLNSCRSRLCMSRLPLFAALICLCTIQHHLLDSLQHGPLPWHAASCRNSEFEFKYCVHFRESCDTFQLSLAPSYVQKLRAIRSDMDSTRTMVPPLARASTKLFFRSIFFYCSPLGSLF